jgi:hypothetical protein
LEAFLKYLLQAIIALILTSTAYAQSNIDQAKPIQESDILPYLEQVIAWNGAVVEKENLPDNAREVLLKDKIKQNSKKIMLKSFDFARAQAIILSAPKADSEPSTQEPQTRHGRMLKAAADNKKHISELEAKLADSATPKPTQERIKGELKLAKAQRELLQTMIGIFNTEGDNSGSITDQVNALARTIDEPADNGQNTKEIVAVKSAPSKDKDDSVQDNDGMFSLASAMFSYSRKKTEIDNLIKQTRELAATNKSLSASIRKELRAALNDGNAMSAEKEDDKQSLAEYRKSIDALMLRYKQLSAAIIPIGEMNVLLEKTSANLDEWSKLIGDDWNRVFQQLVLRLIILSIAIAIPLVLSSIAHRAIGRYIKDSKRKKQLNIVRRIILVAVLAFVILANFISEFGSLATFAGFITAGLAVALQTVLVSLVAHFFFFGRFGVRAGDRITVSGVTGDVVQVGMLRLYMRELDDDGKPSGKIVAFPNSILFQPTAFYKHMDDYR